MAGELTEQPVIPDYLGPNVRGIIPALLGPEPWTSLPSWFPESVRGARQVVLLIIDGLGWDQFVEYRSLVPTLRSMTGQAITTVAPTTTATALCSIATGLTPGEHGLIGYRIVLHGDVLNVLRWASSQGSDKRRAVPPAQAQPFAPFLGRTVPVISPADLEGTAFTEAHLRGSRPVGYRAPSAIAVEVRRQLAAGEPFVYAYYGSVDKTAHERGFGEFYEAELRMADHIVASVLEVLPVGAVLLVTADHGQVEVGDRVLTPDPRLLAMVAMQSGEGRFRWWHVQRATIDEVAKAAIDAYGDVAWVVTKDQVLDERWFGPTVSGPVASRLGDIAIVARDNVSFHDPLDAGAFPLVCRHGSLTSAEVFVPLLASAPAD